MTEIPVLTTERLVLRGFVEADFESYASMMASPDVMRFLGTGQPMSRADAWRQMAMILGHWQLRGFGLWAVEHRATGALIGRIGCHQPEGWPDFELGYALGREHWGQGFAREGARAALTFAREVLRRDRVISLIRPDNTASRRVAESFGATVESEVELFGGTSLIYAYPPASDRCG